MSKLSYAKLPRCSLGFFPTPLIELANLSKVMGGPRLYMKRDDQTGLGMGGNKVRKLEFLVGEALALGCDTLITGGASQSNHCRQTAAAAARCGLACHLVLGGEAPEIPSGNLLLDRLFGAGIHWSGELRKGERIPIISEALKKQGRKPYVVPYGGSNTTGAVGFIEAYREIQQQQKELEIDLSHIIFASSSGGTQAGLTLGKEIFMDSANLIGIGIDKGEADEGPFVEHVIDLTNQTAKSLGIEKRFGNAEIVVREEFLGDGYGIVGDAERSAITTVAKTEGILLDPVYTGRAMAGMLEMIRSGEFTGKDSVLFWHTGGTPALFHYASDLAGSDNVV